MLDAPGDGLLPPVDTLSFIHLIMYRLVPAWPPVFSLHNACWVTQTTFIMNLPEIHKIVAGSQRVLGL